MSILRPHLSLFIPSDTSNHALERTRGPVRHAGSEIVDLALSLLAFACGVLLAAVAFEGLDTWC